MEHIERIGYVLLCLLVPAAWGLLVEWVFHVARTRRDSRSAVCDPPAPTPPPNQRSGEQ